MKFLVPLMLLGAFCFAEDIKCGTKGKGNEKIVGGKIAKKNSWPWQVSISRTGGFHFCGGSIIKPNWIVTADHCIKNETKPEDYKVTVGEHNLRKKGDEKEFEIEDIIRHDKARGIYDYDILLLKLKTNITYDDKIRPVCLQTQDFPVGTNCTVTGWGYLKEGSGHIPSRLRQAVVPLVSDKDCRDAYKNFKPDITPRMLCAGYPQGSIDSCSHDSGGPLVCKNESGAWELVGVVSWGDGCARKNKYGVYTKVEELKDWIETSVKEN